MKSLKPLRIKISIILLFIYTSLFATQYKEIHVVSHGWHTGIILKTEDINSSDLKLDSFFQKHNFVEIGWGDEDFYKSADPSICMTLKAALLPTSSVLHVTPLNDLKMFSKDSIVKIPLSKKAFTDLSKFIEDSFAKKESRHIYISKGKYQNSSFYLSNKDYHIFRTCNVWTAEALESAGVDISPFSALTSDALFSQIRNSKKRSINEDN